jgi:4-hydroxybenzoate polyprenyltransferase
LLSREIIKGCEDIEGDKKEGVKTLAIRIGVNKSKYIAMTIGILAIIFYILPYFTNILNPLLFLISMAFGLIVVAFAVILMAKNNLIKENFSKISRLLKIGAYLGLVAFLLASIA